MSTGAFSTPYVGQDFDGAFWGAFGLAQRETTNADISIDSMLRKDFFGDHAVHDSILSPEENRFHRVMKEKAMRQDGDRITGFKLRDAIDQAALSDIYATEIENRRQEIEREARTVEEEFNMNFSGSALASVATTGRSERSQFLHREAREARAERDLWSLLDILTRAELLCDIDDAQCDESLDYAISQLTERASVQEVVNVALSSDLRIKKGRVLIEWLESTAVDRVTLAPESRGDPWAATLSAIVRDRRGVRSSITTAAAAALPGTIQSIHPDAQLSDGNLVLPLEGSDNDQQEVLLKSIWQLIRCGQIREAQELAARHKQFWLAASLLGVSDHFYETTTAAPAEGDMEGVDQVEVVHSRGNIRRPVWLRTCWRHAEKLDANPGNWGTADKGSGRPSMSSGTVVGLLEMSICAALSGNLPVLLKSPMLTGWSDRLWAVLRATHERDLMKVVHGHRKGKAAYSARFPGCDDHVLTAERDLLSLSEPHIGHLRIADCTSVFTKITPLSSGGTSASITLSPARGAAELAAQIPSYGNSKAESLILYLQACVMEGRSGLKRYIDTVFPLILKNKAEQQFLGAARILRLFCHLALWVHHSAPGSTDLEDLISEEYVQLAVEAYAMHLIETRTHVDLVAAYCAHLHGPRRIATYAALLKAVTTDAQSSSAATAHSKHGDATAAALVPFGSGSDMPAPSLASSLASSLHVEAEELVRLAAEFFPADLRAILELVVQGGISRLTDFESLLLCLPTTVKAPEVSSALSSSPAPTNAATAVRFSETSSVIPSTPSAVGLASVGGRAQPRSSIGWRRGAPSTPYAYAAPDATPYVSTPANAFGNYGVGTPFTASRVFTPKSGLHGSVSSPALSAVAAAAVATQPVAEQPRNQATEDADGNRIVDTSRMQWIRWLLVDPTHRIDAVQHANRLLCTFFLESCGGSSKGGGGHVPSSLSSTQYWRTRLVPFKTVFSRTLPATVFLDGFAALEGRAEQLRIQAVENARVHIIEQMQSHQVTDMTDAEIDKAAEDSAQAEIENLISEERARWESSAYQLLQWRSFVTAMEDVTEFATALREFYTAADRLVGPTHVLENSLARYRSRMENAAEIATQSILYALLGDFSHDVAMEQIAGLFADSVGGIRDVWKSSCKTVTNSVRRNAVEAQQKITASLVSSASNTDSFPALMKKRDAPPADAVLKGRISEERIQRYKEVLEDLQRTAAAKKPLTVDEVIAAVDRDFSAAQEVGDDPAAVVSTIDSIAAAVSAAEAALYTADESEVVFEGIDIVKSSLATLVAVSAEHERFREEAARAAEEAPQATAASPFVGAALFPRTPAAVGHSNISACRYSPETIADIELSVACALRGCQIHFDDLKVLSDVASSLTFVLLYEYLQVVIATADALAATLKKPVDAHRWLARGAQLADLIAKEDRSLQLYRLITSSDLESLLQKINSCALKMMEINPIFTVEDITS